MLEGMKWNNWRRMLPNTTHPYPSLPYTGMGFLFQHALLSHTFPSYKPPYNLFSSPNLKLVSAFAYHLDKWSHLLVMLPNFMMLPNIFLLFPFISLPSSSSYFKHMAVVVKWRRPQLQTWRRNCKHLWFIVQWTGKEAEKYQELILFNFLLCVTAEGEKNIVYNKDTIINYITRS